MLVCLFIQFIHSASISAQPKYRPDIKSDYAASIFVVTNRMIEPDEEGRLVYTNKVDTSNSLKFVKVTFIDDEWFSEPYSGLDELFDNPAPYRDWAVWVHGDGQSFLLSMKRALEIQHLHQVNFIVFSWPTKAPDKGPIGNFKTSMQNAQLSVPYFTELCMDLQEYRSKTANRMSDENLSVFFHSLANYMLMLAVEQGALEDIEAGFFDNTILNAPAVESEGHYKWIEKLGMQDRIFVCYNDEDINLEGLRILSSLGVQLGERPMEPLATNAAYFDFTYSVGSRSNTGATHSYYYALITELSQNIRELYKDLFHGRNLIPDDQGRFDHTKQKQVYQIKF